MEIDKKKYSKEELIEKIEFLQDELFKKDNIIEKLKEENKTIMQTAIKNAQKRINVEDMKNIKEKHS